MAGMDGMDGMDGMYVYVCMHACMHEWMCGHVRACMHTGWMDVCACIHACMHACMYVWVCMYGRCMMDDGWCVMDDVRWMMYDGWWGKGINIDIYKHVIFMLTHDNINATSSSSSSSSSSAHTYMHTRIHSYIHTYICWGNYCIYYVGVDGLGFMEDELCYFSILGLRADCSCMMN